MEAIDVWVQLIQDGKEHLEPVPIEVHLSCTIHDLKGQVMRKFAGDLPTSAAEQHLTVSQSKSSQDEGQRLKPLASMESELARLAISSTSPLVLFVHVPPKEDLQVCSWISPMRLNCLCCTLAIYLSRWRRTGIRESSGPHHW